MRTTGRPPAAPVPEAVPAPLLSPVLLALEDNTEIETTAKVLASAIAEGLIVKRA